MKISVGEDGQLIGKELYNSLQLITNDDEQLVISMRDSGFEFIYGGIKFEAKEGSVSKVGEVIKQSPKVDVEENHVYQMWGLVPYNISPIQAGIQFGHAKDEYILEHWGDPKLQKWLRKDKTYIIKNGGTTNTNPERLGTLNQHLITLREMGVTVAEFREPDLGDQLLGITFLVDERVWDKETYPDPPITERGRDKVLTSKPSYAYTEAIKKMGGEEIYRLREFLKQFRFA